MQNEIFPKLAKFLCANAKLQQERPNKNIRRKRKKLLKDIKHLPVKPEFVFSRQKLLEAEKLFKLTIKKLTRAVQQESENK